MNKRMVVFLLGRILFVEAAMMALPAALAAFTRGSDLKAFLITMGLAALSGLLLSLKKPKNKAIYAKEGLVTVALGWVLMAAFGALPLTLSGAVPSYIDALFEMTSGFTTTGATILNAVEHLPKGILLWRSFSHWIGGMGVLVLIMAILPSDQNRSMVLMRAEVPGPEAGKLVPKMSSTAKILYGTYTGLTVLLFVFLLAGGMPLFDAFCNAVGTAGTGGFAVRDAGIAAYDSAYVDVVISVFMLLFSLNFNLYYLILIGKAKEALKNEELRDYLIMVAAVLLLIASNISRLYGSFGEALRYSFFQVTAISSTTGFATADFAKWPVFSQQILLLLMLFGGCAGSTAGGLKFSRVIICVKSAAQEFRHVIHPKTVTVIRLNGAPVEKETLKGVRNYLIAYSLILILVTLLISALDGQYDLLTHITASVACFNNIGPGLSSVGPMCNFSGYSAVSKVILTVAMLAGRLEVYPVLLILSPKTWRRNAN